MAQETLKKITYKEIILFTLPSIISVAAEPLAGLIDSALIGQHNSRWLAGLAICTTIFSSFVWVFNFLVHGVTARIGQAFGANDSESMERDYAIAVLLSLVLGVVSCVVLLLLRRTLFLDVMGTSHDITELTFGYYFVRAIGMPAAILLHTSIAVLRGLKRINESLWVIVMVTAFNAAGSYYSIYLSEFGFVGVGVATTSSFVLGSVFCLYLIKRSGLRMRLNFKDNIMTHLGSFSKEAWYMAGRTMSLLACFFVATSLASRLGELQVAAHQILHQFWILAAFIVDGIAITANAMGAPFIGARKYDLFKDLGRKLLVMGFYCGVLISGLYWFGRIELTGVFTRDDDVLKIVFHVWPLIAIAQIPNALVFVADGLVFAMRDFRFIRQWMFIGAIVAFLPCALVSYYFYQDLMVIWLGLTLLSLIRLFSNGYRFFKLERYI